MAEPSPTALSALHRTLGYAFRDPNLLQAALIHTSYVNERPTRGLESNERLEFLGDAVLGVVVAHRLYASRPESPEGELTVVRAWLVRQSTLARWARQVALGPYPLLGRGEGRAAAGAIGGAAVTRVRGGHRGDLSRRRDRCRQRRARAAHRPGGQKAGFSAHAWSCQVASAAGDQARFEQTPAYSMVDHSGPGMRRVRGRGARRTRGHRPRQRRSKRAAQQVAAHAALQRLDVKEATDPPTKSD